MRISYGGRRPSTVIWADEIKPDDVPADDVEQERKLSHSWRALLIQKTPFHPSESEGYRDLVDVYRRLESVFLESPELHEYYVQCTHPVSYTRSQVQQVTGAPWKLRHVVMLQAQFMEDAYYVLRLDRYANAPDNRGWMMLFRRWARLGEFNEVFQPIRNLFTKDFNDFFDNYLFGWDSVDWIPIPHPWDSVDRRGDSVPGVFLDSGIREAASERIRRRLSSGRGSFSGSEEGEHGAPAAKESAGRTSGAHNASQQQDGPTGSNA